jgi:hypothetical protein
MKIKDKLYVYNYQIMVKSEKTKPQMNADKRRFIASEFIRVLS